ncbi:DUF2190 family protein [Salinarimonas chemoclinalis]|uniref:DUF2190 family protein n=1 Tax=Salinarimonas chemoclinalis TaxID=3241599 RepID=UPI003558027B
MRNHVQPGNLITVTAPAGGVTSGAGVLVGSLFGVAATTAAAGAPVEIATTGVYDLPKAGATTFTAGAPVYWNAAAGEAAALAAGRPLVGVATEAAADGATTARVRLNGVFGAAPSETTADLESRLAALEAAP